VRQIRMLRAMRRELETGLRQLLCGHEGGNLGYSQEAAYGSPRQFPTLQASSIGSTSLCHVGRSLCRRTAESPCNRVAHPRS